MNKIGALAFNELRMFFYTPVAWILGFSLYAVQGVLFWYLVNRANIPGESVEGGLVMQLMGGIVFWLTLLILIPVISMRLFAFENENKSLSHLFTLPVTDLELLLGKFFGGFLFYLILWTPGLLHLLLIKNAAHLEWGLILTAYAGVCFTGAFLLSAGVLTSVLFSSQIASAIGAFFLVTGLLVCSLMEGLLENSNLKDFIAVLNFADHHSNLCTGIVDSRDLVFFISGTLFFLGVTLEWIRHVRSGRMGRKWPEALVFVILIFALLTGINYLSSRHYLRKDFTQNRLYTLSKASEIVAGDLKADVDIYVYFKPEHELTVMLKNLLTSYEAFSRRLHVHWIDPYYDYALLTQLGDLGKNLKLNSILLKSETRHRYLSVNDLGVYDRRLEQFGVDSKLISFNGESAITGALTDLSNPEAPLIGLLSNHGERSFAGEEDSGASALIKMLSLQGYQFASLDLNKVAQVPDKVRSVVCLGPRMDFTTEELNMLSAYLRKGGSLFIATDPYVHATDKSMMNFGLTPLLDAWGISLENTVVIDPSKQIPHSRPDNLYIDYYSDFEIVNDMKNLPTIFFQARSLGVHKTEECTVAPLMATTDKGWGESDYANADYQFDPSKDKKGPNYIGVASQNEKNRGKMVIFGDSDFLTNSQIRNTGNAKLLENCFYWMLDKADLLKIPPKPALESPLSLKREDLLRLLGLGVLAPPLAVFILGGVMLFRRKNRG